MTDTITTDMSTNPQDQLCTAKSQFSWSTIHKKSY